MTTTNSYKDTKAVDYLEAIKRNQLESRNSKSSSSNFDMTYMLPIKSAIGISTTVTSTEKTIGDYGIIDNTPYLVAYLPMDYDVRDASNSNHGTVTGTETYVDHSPEISSTHPLRKAFSFNGSSYITLANESNFDFERTSNFSISFWIKGGTLGVFEEFISKGAINTVGWSIYSNIDNFLEFQLFSSAGSQLFARYAADITDGNWHHVVWTYNGNSDISGVKVYIDGTSRTVTTIFNTLTTSILNNNALILGADPLGGNKFTGQLNDVQIWNVELSSTDVTDLYAGKQINKSPVTKPAILGLSDVT